MREELLDAFERIAASRFFARQARIGFSVHTALALQLSFFEVSALSGSLVSSAPERPCDDVCGLNALLSESGGDAADFLD
jgi:hypothetical protein